MLPAGSVSSCRRGPPSAGGGNTGNRCAPGSCRLGFPPKRVLHGPSCPAPSCPLALLRKPWVPSGSARRRAKLVLLADWCRDTPEFSRSECLCPSPSCPPFPTRSKCWAMELSRRTRRKGLTMPIRPPSHAHRQESDEPDGVWPWSFPGIRARGWPPTHPALGSVVSASQAARGKANGQQTVQQSAWAFACCLWSTHQLSNFPNKSVSTTLPGEKLSRSNLLAALLEIQV